MTPVLLEEIAVAPKAFAAYAPFNGGVHEDALRLAAPLAGTAVVHVNSTEKGGGVAELLRSQVALERNLGLISRWVVVRPSTSAFFGVTRRLHNLLQGADEKISADELRLYERESNRLADALQAWLGNVQPALIVAHDPQPLRTVAVLHTAAAKILRLHVDLQAPHAFAVRWLCATAADTSRVVVSRQDCALPCFSAAQQPVIAPAIDPLTTKNRPLPSSRVHTIMAAHGIDTRRPLIAQISRFDVWKDQLGVVAAYREARRTIKDLQLVLVGFFQADDDSEAREYCAHVRDAAGGDPRVFIFSDLAQLVEVDNEVFINAVQTASDVVLQKSIREGFGLTVTEAMWKGKAVIGGNAGGIQLQIVPGENGLLVNSVAETAQSIIQLLHDDELRRRLGEAARASVAEHYLISRFVRDNLYLYGQVVGRTAA